MAHLYASFNDAALAEKAAGALLDYGVQKEDVSIVANDAYSENRLAQHTDNTTGVRHSLSGVGDSAIDYTKSGGDRLAQAGDRLAGVVTGAVGATGTSARYEAGAEVHADNAGMRSQMARDEGLVQDSNMYNTTAPYGSTVEAGTLSNGTDDGSDYEAAAKHGISTTTPEDAGHGAIKGTEIGLGVGILAGIAALLIPGVGLVLGGGALAAAIGGAALTAGAGAIAGGVTGYLKEQGVPGEAAQRYQDAVENGGAILNISLPSGKVDQALAEQVLGKYGAADVHSY